ncbi:MAG: nitrate reductase cytochrome c-type subunit [Campylobacteraceae bacterium]|nr:nitrate reductase cytochrome c-type subunit [Campylobacteraceae bacterium]
MKKMIFNTILFGVLVFALAGCLTTAYEKTFASDDIGLRKTSLFDEGNIDLAGITYISTPAGESKLIERAFENAPPLISHDVEGMMEITRDLNMCTSCHLPEIAVDLGATAMPKSHFLSMITGKDLGDQMDEARYNCTTCHVPQAIEVGQLVKNSFDPNFRNKTSEFQSNLADILNEGIQ